MTDDEREEATEHLQRAIVLITIYYAHPNGVPETAPERAALDSYLQTDLDRRNMISGLAALCRTLLTLIGQANGGDAQAVLGAIAEANQITPE